MNSVKIISKWQLQMFPFASVVWHAGWTNFLWSETAVSITFIHIRTSGMGTIFLMLVLEVIEQKVNTMTWPGYVCSPNFEYMHIKNVWRVEQESNDGVDKYKWLCYVQLCGWSVFDANNVLSKCLPIRAKYPHRFVDLYLSSAYGLYYILAEYIYSL